MKKLTAAILTLALILTAATACAYEYRFTLDADRLYPNTGIVIEVNRYEDFVRCVDAAGLEWIFPDADDWTEGDLVSLMMFDNFTDGVSDDTVMVAYYAGFGGLDLMNEWKSRME